MKNIGKYICMYYVGSYEEYLYIHAVCMRM